MNRLENKLRDALKRVEPPTGFSERVLARTLEAKQNARAGLFAWRHLRWGLAGALCLALVMAGIEYRAQEERARSEAAKQQLMLALRIAGDQLQFVWSKVNQP